MSTAATAKVNATTVGADVPADALPEWLKISRRAVGIVLFLAVAFWSLSWLPLWHTDLDRKSTRLNSSHIQKSRMPSSA